MKTKSIVVTIAALTLSALIYSFTIDETPTKKTSYCDIVCVEESKGIFIKTTVSVDFGTTSPAEKVPAFSEPVNALNHLAGQGWELVSVYTLSNPAYKSVRHYVMKRTETTQ